MDLELFPLLIGVAIGGIFGANGKNVMKPIAKGYFTLAERAKEMSANMREDMRDAIEEARYERQQEAMVRDEALRGNAAQAPASEAAPTRRRRSTTGRATTGRRASTNGRRRRNTGAAAE